MQRLGPESYQTADIDGDDDAVDAPVIVTSPTGHESDETQPFISVYEWHFETTNGGDDVAEQLSARISELTPHFYAYCAARLARLEAAEAETKKQTRELQINNRFRKQMTALNAKLPTDRKGLQSLFLNQVEAGISEAAGVGGTGALLKLVAEKVSQRSTATATARRAGGGGSGGGSGGKCGAGSGGKSKGEKAKGSFDIFDKGDEGLKDSLAHGLIDVDAVSKDGTTPLMVAARAIDRVSVYFLIKAGADVTKESKTEPKKIAAFLESKRASELLELDANDRFVVDDDQFAVVKDGVSVEGEHPDFEGDECRQMVCMLAGALAISERKAAAVKKQREDAEKQLQEWDDDVDATTKTKAAASGGGGGGGKKKGKGKKKMKKKPPVKQAEKSAAVNASSLSTTLPDSASAADEKTSSSSSSSSSSRRRPTASEEADDRMQQENMLSSTERRDKALEKLNALCARLSKVDAKFADETSGDAMTVKSAALTAAVKRAEMKLVQQTASHKAQLAAMQRKYDSGAGALVEAGRMQFEAAFKDVGIDGRDAAGHVTIAGAEAYGAACDAALDARENAEKEAAMANARASADARGDEYTLACADADAMASQTASDDKHDMNLDSMTMSEVLVLMAAPCGNLAAYCETQPWNETACEKALGAADLTHFSPEFIAMITPQITATASPPQTIAAAAPAAVASPFMVNGGIGAAVAASANATYTPSYSTDTQSVR
jgi:hypothetical protein